MVTCAPCSYREKLQVLCPGYCTRPWALQTRVDIVAGVPFRVGAPNLADHFMVDCLENIAVNKVTSIPGRFDPKDYVDLDELRSFCHALRDRLLDSIRP
jgi:hypothetical protein